MGTAIWGQKKKEGAAELILSVFGGGQAEKGRIHADPFYSQNSLILLAHNFHFDLLRQREGDQRPELEGELLGLGLPKEHVLLRSRMNGLAPLQGDG